MIIYNKSLSVVPITTHIKVKEISKILKKIFNKKIKTLINIIKSILIKSSNSSSGFKST